MTRTAAAEQNEAHDAGDGFRYDLPLGQVLPSKTNPRKHFDAGYIAELTASVREHGVLQPILVRPVVGNMYEIVAGECRYRAAVAAERSTIPAIVRELTDEQALEIQVIENLQRRDLHPLEEAAGYKALLGFGQTIERVAERLGRSVKYVYDRIKLLHLTPEARKVFEAGEITAGHAIILARLTHEEQKRALEDQREGVFQSERTLYDPHATDEEDKARFQARKARSVRELQAYVDTHIRFRPEAVDQMLFPETAAALAEIEQDRRGPVLVTYQHMLDDDAKDPNGPRVYSVRSWKNASGQGDEDPAGVHGKSRASKTCEKSRLGVFIAGPGRGDTLQVCVSKSCAVHWPEKKPAKKGKAAGQSKDAQREEYTKQEADRRAKEAAREAKRVRWNKALPAIRKALTARIGELGVKPNGPVWNLAASSVYGHGRNLLGKAKDADGFVRALAAGQVDRLDEWRAALDCPWLGKALGVDVKKLLDEHAPIEKPKVEKKAAKPRGKKK